MRAKRSRNTFSRSPIKRSLRKRDYNNCSLTHLPVS